MSNNANTQKVKDTISASKNATEEAVNLTRDNFAKGADVSRKQFETASGAALQGFDQIARVHQDQFAAAAQATERFTKAWEVVSGQAASFAQKEVDAFLSTTRKVVDAKAVDDVVKAETDYVSARLNTLATDGVKFMETGLKAFQEAVQPIQKQFRTNLERSLAQIS